MYSTLNNKEYQEQFKVSVSNPVSQRTSDKSERSIDSSEIVPSPQPRKLLSVPALLLRSTGPRDYSNVEAIRAKLQSSVNVKVPVQLFLFYYTVYGNKILLTFRKNMLSPSSE